MAVAAMLFAGMVQAEEKTVLTSERDKVSYMIGADVGGSISSVGPDLDVAAFERALAQPSVIASVEKNGGQVSVSDEATYVRGFNDEIKFTEAMMKKIGLQPT